MEPVRAQEHQLETSFEPSKQERDPFNSLSNLLVTPKPPRTRLLSLSLSNRSLAKRMIRSRLPQQPQRSPSLKDIPRCSSRNESGCRNRVELNTKKETNNLSSRLPSLVLLSLNSPHNPPPPSQPPLSPPQPPPTHPSPSPLHPPAATQPTAQLYRARRSKSDLRSRREQLGGGWTSRSGRGRLGGSRFGTGGGLFCRRSGRGVWVLRRSVDQGGRRTRLGMSRSVVERRS